MKAARALPATSEPASWTSLTSVRAFHWALVGGVHEFEEAIGAFLGGIGVGRAEHGSDREQRHGDGTAKQTMGNHARVITDAAAPTMPERRVPWGD
jgi:hypothetical protein